MAAAPASGRTVLVTGGAGFIGSHLVEELVEPNVVRMLDNLTTGPREWVPEEVRFVEGYVRNDPTVTEAIEDVDLVFHEDAQVDVTASVEAPRRGMRSMRRRRSRYSNTPDRTGPVSCSLRAPRSTVTLRRSLSTTPRRPSPGRHMA